MKKKLFAWLLATMLCIPAALQSSAAQKPNGDINADGALDIMDVILLQKWLLAVPQTHIADPEAGDFDADGTLDVFDLALMKMAVVGNPTDILPPDEPTNIGFHSYEAYEGFVQEVHDAGLEEKFISYEQIRDFGEFRTLSVNAHWMYDGYFNLSYTLDDGSGYTFLLLVNDRNQGKEDLNAYPKLPDEMMDLSDMRHAETDAYHAYYEVNDKQYIYVHGDLSLIRWQDDAHWYILTGKPMLSEYPGAQDTELAKLLYVTDSAPVVPPNITDEDYQNVYDRFKTDGYVYQITENEITLRTDRKSNILVRTAYEDMGIVYHVNYKDKYYQVYFYNADPDFVQENQTMPEYINARFQYTAPIREIDEVSCIMTADDDTLQAFRHIDNEHYYKVRTIYADEAEIMEFLEQLQFEKAAY